MPIRILSVILAIVLGSSFDWNVKELSTNIYTEDNIEGSPLMLRKEFLPEPLKAALDEPESFADINTQAKLITLDQWKVIELKYQVKLCEMMVNYFNSIMKLTDITNDFFNLNNFKDIPEEQDIMDEFDFSSEIYNNIIGALAADVVNSKIQVDYSSTGNYSFQYT
jgi:hypothetical protein